MKKRVEGLRAGIDVGAMINGARLPTLEKLVADAVKQGARLLVGGQSFEHPRHPSAHFFSPTLLCDVTPDMAIANEECFAPIMLVMSSNVGVRCTSLDPVLELDANIVHLSRLPQNVEDSIRIANSTKYVSPPSDLATASVRAET